MSNGITINEFAARVAPQKTIDITGTGSALQTQGQFNAIGASTEVVKPDAGHTVVISCDLANEQGKVDPKSMLEIAINAGAVAIDGISVGIGTLLGHSATLLTSPTALIHVAPNASGRVVCTIALHAAKTGTIVGLKHRQYSANATITVA